MTWRFRALGGRHLVAAAGLLLVCIGPRTAPASVAEQRARLPPPARCEDPVVGTWRAHIYHAQWRFWGIYTLEIRRKPGSESELVGRMLSEFWDGVPEESDPGHCSPKTPYRARVVQNATGRYSESEVRFDGLDWKLDRMVCGSWPPSLGYNPDHFSGHIDPAIQEFQSVNNDGGISVNVPVVFRRIKCEGPPPEEPVDRPHVVPPPFLPPRNDGC